ncbi:hypothetical protein [Pseudoclavibacter sp. CFCC 11306]|uniref:hypothetical protein n=1 Tax=Pseudoclavibacter sp. CFCC 11306 TaxID=1564493 RepID=UPI001301155A|nr:hypothetical protein [Pseudoclavibacter sp. CFCC 11306]KAB1657679.1 hypothetical protein F8O09_08665 [Pseudoclavibacter sp. CFCC 11306]
MSTADELLRVAREESPALEMADPQIWEALGARLAQKLRVDNAQVIVVRHEVANALLGHVVARELGIPLITVADDEGVLYFSTDFAADCERAAIVTTIPEAYPSVSALISAIRSKNVQVTSVGTVLPDDAHLIPALVPTRCLEDDH